MQPSYIISNCYPILLIFKQFYLTSKRYYCCIVICWFMQKYTYICWIHTDAINKDACRIKTQEDFFTNIFTSHFIARVHVGESWRPNINCNILTPGLWLSHCVFLVLLMLGSTPSGFPKGPLGRVWLSLPHLVSNSLEFYW